MNLKDWGEELDYSLKNGPGTPALLTVASCSGEQAEAEVLDVAAQLAGGAGWRMCVRSAEQPLTAMLELEGSCLLALRGVSAQVPVSVPVLVGAFQHLVTQGHQVGLLVTGTPEGIQELRRHPAMGFLSRAESVEHTA